MRHSNIASKLVGIIIVVFMLASCGNPYSRSSATKTAAHANKMNAISGNPKTCKRWEID